MITKIKCTKGIILFLIPLIVSQCKQFKKPSACIDGPREVELNQTVTYTWCGSDADEINWDADYGFKGEGKSVDITFTHYGSNFVSVRGNNKRSDEGHTSMEVKVVKPSYVWFTITNQCLTGGSVIINSPDIVNYKAYLYASKPDWKTDITNGNHSKCIDSTTCYYDSEKRNVGALFKKQLPTGSVVFAGIECRNPDEPNNYLSNWAEALGTGVSSSYITIENNENSDNYGYANLTNITKKLLVGKWRLSKITTNGTSTNPAACNQDDYLKFYPDGTYRYIIGSDDCNGSSSESTGEYSFGTQCISSSDVYMTLNPTSGPFTGFTNCQVKNNFSLLQVSTVAGGNTILFDFTFSK